MKNEKKDKKDGIHPALCFLLAIGSALGMAILGWEIIVIMILGIGGM